MSTHDPISAWRDTAGPTKAPTATPIPSISLQRFQLRSNSRKNVLDMPLTLAWTPTPAGAKTETAGAGTKCLRMTRSLLGVTLLGLQRHQQQRLYQALPLPSNSRENNRKNILDMLLTLAWTTTPSGAKTETAGAGTRCPTGLHCLVRHFQKPWRSVLVKLAQSPSSTSPPTGCNLNTPSGVLHQKDIAEPW